MNIKKSLIAEMIDAHVLLPSKCDEINYLSEIPAKNGAKCSTEHFE